MSIITSLNAMEEIAPAVYFPIPLTSSREEAVFGNSPPPSTIVFAPYKVIKNAK